MIVVFKPFLAKCFKDSLILLIMANYDVIGNIVIVKFNRKTKASEKKEFALQFLKKNKNVRTVLEKSRKFSGRLRTQKTRFIAGERNKEALYRENDCSFRLNVDSCYFSPRLASERKEIAYFVRKRENVLVLFGGIGVYAIAIARLSEAKRVISVEISRECNKYARENVKRNKLENVDIIQGDVRRILKKMKEKFDRIIMPRPNLKDSFLDAAFSRIKKNGTMYYYGFYRKEEENELKKLITEKAKRAGKKIKILKIKKAGEIGVRKYRYRADIKVFK